MAKRIAAQMAAKTQREPRIGTLDINLYRDDLTRVAFQPVVQKTEVPPNIDDRDVILVDDVLYTGRTVRGIDVCDFGRMRSIQLAVAIDRGHRNCHRGEFLQRVPTKDNEVVEVKLREIDGEDAIYVMEKSRRAEDLLGMRSQPRRDSGDFDKAESFQSSAPDQKFHAFAAGRSSTLF